MGMLSQMQPYTPSLYEPNGYGRYRQYPHNVDTPIPGAGYDVGEMVWAEQELNLDGNVPPQPYGNYAVVPLRGVGALDPALLTSRTLITTSLMPALLSVSPSGHGPALNTVGDDPPALPPPPEEPLAPQPPAGFFARRVGPVPLWALLAGGAAAVGGGAWWYLKK